MKKDETQTDYTSDQIQQLIKDLMGDEAMAREKARLALIEIGKPAIDYLLELVYAKKDIWRWEAVKALGQIADPVTIPILMDALEDRNGGVRWLAAEGLSRFGVDVVQPLLREFITRPDAIFLRQGVHHVLFQLEKDLEFDGAIDSFLATLRSSASPERALIEASNLIRYFEKYRDKET